MRRIGLLAIGLGLVLSSCAALIGLEDHGSRASADADAEAGDLDVTDAAADAGDASDSALSCDPDAFVIRDAAICDGSMTFLTTDPANCGACDHSCFGGNCAGGLCTPVTLYNEPNEGGMPNIGGFALGVTDSDLYWSYPNDKTLAVTAVRRMPKDGGAPPRDIASIPGSTGIALDPTGLYYVTGTHDLFRVDLDGGQPALLGTVPPVGYVGMALDPMNVYFADGFSSIFTFPKDGGGITTIPKQDVPYDIVADPPWLAWLNEPWRVTGDAGPGSLERRNGATPPTSLSLPKPSGLAFDSAYFYWFESSTGQLMQLGKNSPDAGPTSLGTMDASSPTDPARNILPDGARIFAAVGSPGVSMNIVEFSACGASPRTLYREYDPVYGAIVHDEQFIYWATFGGHVRRLAK
jgi:hypothetical protein